MINEDTRALLERNGIQQEDLSDVVVTMDDIRAAGYCGPGLRDWMATHGFDLRAFVQNGMSALQMVSTNDGHGIRVVLNKLTGAPGGR